MTFVIWMQHRLKDSIKPMEAVQLALGAVRLLWASGKED